MGSKVASTSSTRRAVGAPGELVREILVAKLDLYVELCTCWPRCQDVETCQRGVYP